MRRGGRLQGVNFQRNVGNVPRLNSRFYKISRVDLRQPQKNLILIMFIRKSVDAFYYLMSCDNIHTVLLLLLMFLKLFHALSSIRNALLGSNFHLSSPFYGKTEGCK